jgi:hypothetical protein
VRKREELSKTRKKWQSSVRKRGFERYALEQTRPCTQDTDFEAHARPMRAGYNLCVDTL